MKKFGLELYFVAVQHEHRNIGDALPWYSHDIVAGPFVKHEQAITESAHHVEYAAQRNGELVVVSGAVTIKDFGVI